jgi:hypothetical protein
MVFVCSLPGIFAFGLLAIRLQRLRLTTRLLVLGALCFSVLGLSGCGSIENSSTPPGTYNFIITATGRTGVSQFVNLTMTITK